MTFNPRVENEKVDFKYPLLTRRNSNSGSVTGEVDYAGRSYKDLAGEESAKSEQTIFWTISSAISDTCEVKWNGDASSLDATVAQPSVDSVNERVNQRASLLFGPYDSACGEEMKIPHDWQWVFAEESASDEREAGFQISRPAKSRRSLQAASENQSATGTKRRQRTEFTTQLDVEPVAKKRKMHAKDGLPSVNLLDPRDLDPEMYACKEMIEDEPKFIGCKRVLMDKAFEHVLYNLTGLAEGNHQHVWETDSTVYDMPIVIKTFKPMLEGFKRRIMIKELFSAMEVISKRADVSVPLLLNDVYQDGYFVWERVYGEKATVADVKGILKGMLENYEENILADFRPDNVMKKENGSLVIVDPSWERADDMQLDLFYLIKGWVCPFKAEKIPVTEFEALMAELDQVNMQPEVRAVWPAVRQEVNQAFYS